MIELLETLGLTNEEIGSIIEINEEILDENLENAKKNIEVLIFFKCEPRHIRNIITVNPYYLTTSNEDVLELICYLKKLGIYPLNILFDSNPYLLNKKGYEIKAFVKYMINNNNSIKDIYYKIYDNPYLFDNIYS